LPPARETRMKPVQMQMVAVTAIQPERVEDGTSVNADCRTQVRLR
jgi:hypothetical protein